MTAVTLTPEAAEHLRQRGETVMLRPSPRHGCCGGTVGVPVAEAGTPEDEAAYEIHDRDGLRVYVHHSLTAAQGLRVGLEGFGPWRRLYVEGAESTLL